MTIEYFYSHKSSPLYLITRSATVADIFKSSSANCWEVVLHCTAVRQCSRCCTSMYLQIKTCGQWLKSMIGLYFTSDRSVDGPPPGSSRQWRPSQLGLATCSTGICIWGRRTSGIGRIWFLSFWTCGWILGCAGHLWQWILGAGFRPSGAQVCRPWWRLYTVVLLLECPSLACSSSGLHSMSSCSRHTQIWQQLAELSPDVGHLSVCVVTKRRLHTPWMVERASRMLFCARWYQQRVGCVSPAPVFA